MNRLTGIAGGMILVAGALACNVGSAAPAATPDLIGTITAQAGQLEGRTLAPSPTGEAATGTEETPPISPASPAPQQPSAPTATRQPKATKTSSPATNTAVPTLSVPQMPGNLAIASSTCATGTTDKGDSIWKSVITLSWQDSDTETAYRLYRNGLPYTTVIWQDATSWPVYVEYAMGPNNSAEYDYFELEAYNSAGASPKAAVYSYRCHS
jgi:hypothetical protein